MGHRSEVNRRDFLAAGAAVATTALLGGGLSGGQEVDKAPRRSRVVLVRRQDVLTAGGQPDAAVLAAMLDDAVVALLGVSSAVEAWRQLIRADDVVGVKSNAWKYLPTPPALEAAIRERIAGVGVKPGDIAVDDRGVLDNPVFERASALVNVRPMRSHHWSGLGTCLKNYIMFVRRPQDYHGEACARLGEIWTHPEVVGRTRLNVLVMLTPQFHGVGPHSFSPTYTWPYGGLIVGTDPVAVDATGARIIQAHRNLHFGEERPLEPKPHHIVVADTVYGLGVSDPACIEVVRLGWEEGALV